MLEDDHDKNIDIVNSTYQVNSTTMNAANGRNTLGYTIDSSTRKDGDTENIINTSVLGERTVTYTYTDSWGRTGTVKRKVTVRPQLYKNKIQVYAEDNENLEGRTTINEDIVDSSNNNTGNINDQNSGSQSPEGSDNSNVETNSKKPAFEIGFNTLTNKYQVINRKDEYLDIQNPRKDIFAIQIKGSDGTVKFEKTLKGNQKGTATELDGLNDITYDATDTIRVWRASSNNSENTSVVVPNLKIIGSIEKDNEIIKEDSYADGISNIDFMNNVGFKPESNGLKAIYNKAPVINGFTEEKEVIEKGTELNLRHNITVTDDNGDNNLSFTVSPEQIDTNQLGIHKVTYTTTDSWNRTTTKIRTIEVVSKVKSNSIQVYNPEESNSDLLFKIDFDASAKKFIINNEVDSSTNLPNEETGNGPQQQESRSGEIVPNEGNGEEVETPGDSTPGETTPPIENVPPADTENAPSQESNDGKIFRIKIFDNNGAVVVNSTVNSLTNISDSQVIESIKEQLGDLTKYTFNIGDTISLWSSNPNKVKIKGTVENESIDYDNGLGEKMGVVRFKITENGLKEIQASTPVITFDEGENKSVEVRRGDAIDYLSGVTVTDTNENIELSKVSYTPNNVNTSVLGENQVTYTVTNSWGQKAEKIRKFNIIPKNDIDGVRLKLKSSTDENNYLEIGFDELNKKLKVYHKPTSALYPEINENVLTISVYNSNGETLKTLQIHGNQTINEEELKKINDSTYTEGLFIEVESKYPENLSITGDIANIHNLNNKNLNLSDGIDENELDTFKNTRFKIGSTQIEAIYNKAPVISYPGKDNESEKNGLITVKKGEIYDYNKDLTVEDDHDGKIEASNVGVDESRVNYDEVGTYEITYIVTDSWGRDGTATRPVKIVSNIVGNQIDIYSKDSTQQQSPSDNETVETLREAVSDNVTEGDNNSPEDTETSAPIKGNRVFSIGFIEEVTSNESEDKNIKIKLEVRNTQNIAIDSSNANKESIKIIAYNKDGNKKDGYELSLNGNDTGTSGKLEKLKTWELEYGDYISLYASDLNEPDSTTNITPQQPSTNENPSERNISIINENSPVEGSSGSNSNETVEGNGGGNSGEESSSTKPNKPEITTSMIRITGGVLNARELYDSGAVKKDNIVNVRFEITDAGLEALYK